MTTRDEFRRDALLALGGLTILFGLTAGCSSSSAVRDQTGHSYRCDNETYLVSVLGTRKHRLSGENPVVGVFYTDDYGRTWNHTGWEQGKAFSATSRPNGCRDTLFIAAGNGVMRSVNGGESWRITTGWRQTEVQAVGVGHASPTLLYSATPYGLFKSVDLGESWENVSPGLGDRFVSSVRVDRGNPRRVFAGTEGGLFLSEDGAETWQSTAVDLPVRSVRQSPHDPLTWALGLQTDGVAVSTDGGHEWQFSEDLAGTVVYESEFDRFDPARLYAGGWDTGLLVSEDLGLTWEHLETVPDNDIHGISLSRFDSNFVMVGTMSDGVYYSHDRGLTWMTADSSIFDAAQVWDVYVAGEE